MQNATKGYEAEAEECLKREFKDWLEGKHSDNLIPHTHNNRAGGGVRRDMHGKEVVDWVPTWWGPNQLTYLPGVREYLREQAIRADKNSLDLNVLAHLGPQNVEEAWAYFKHWVKGRPVGPEECLNPSPLDPSNTNLPNRAGPIHMQHNTQLHPDRPYNPLTGLPPWPGGGGGGGGGGWGFGLGGPRPGPPPSPDDSDDDDDGSVGLGLGLALDPRNVTPEGMIHGRAEGGRDYFFDSSGSQWAEVNAAADRALDEALNVENQLRALEVLNVESQLSPVRSPRSSLPPLPFSVIDTPPPPAPSTPEYMRGVREHLAVPRSRLVRSSADQPFLLLQDAAPITPESAADSGYATEDEVGYRDETYSDDELGVVVSPLAPQPSPPLMFSPPPRGTPWPAITPPPSRSLGPMAPAFNPTIRLRSENPLAAGYKPSPMRGFQSLVTNEVAKRFSRRRNSAVAIGEMV